MSILSRRGYSLPLATTPAAQIAQYKQELTIVPRVEREEYAHLVTPIAVWKATELRLYMPRHYGVQKLGAPDVDKLSTKRYEPAELLVFRGQLRGIQPTVVSAAIDSMRKVGGGVVSIGCGGGKTVCALYCLAAMRVPAIVVCHNTAMMKQWHERIRQFLPEARIGIIRQNRAETDDVDVAIASVKSVAHRAYPKDQFARFGLVVWDEIHLMCTRTFARAFPKLATTYALGLSATPERKDGCHAIFQYFIGPVCFQQKRPPDASVEVRCITLKIDNVTPKYDRRGRMMYTPMVIEAVMHPTRLALVTQLVAQLAGEGRTVLVLSDYVNHLKRLYRMLEEHSPRHPSGRDVTFGLYIGEMTVAQRALSEHKDVILGTKALASVGMDIERLNTLVFASPSKEVEQSTGRIMRKRHEQFPPCIVDLIDDHGLFQAQSRHRKKYYRKCNYTIVHQQMFADGTVRTTKRPRAVKPSSPPADDCMFQHV